MTPPEEQPERPQERGRRARAEDALIDASGRVAKRVLDSRIAGRVWDRVLESDEAQRLVERVAEAPEVRQAITRQGVGLLEDMRGAVRRIARHLDDVVERVARAIVRRPRRTEPTIYAGGVTRLAALALDAAAVNGALLLISAALALIVSALSSGDQSGGNTVIALGATAWLITAGAYLMLFWGLAGRTLGMQFLGLQVLSLEGETLSARACVRRLIGLGLSFLSLGLGFLGVLVGDRRRGWQDRLGHSVVVYADPQIDMHRSRPPGSGP